MSSNESPLHPEGPGPWSESQRGLARPQPGYTATEDVGGRRHKVLHVITHLGAGGALDNTLLTCAGLARSRYEVSLAAGMIPPGSGYESWEERTRDSVDALHHIADLSRQVDGRRDLRALRSLTRLMRERRFDLVHTHGAKAGVVGRVAARRAGVPVILHTCHAFGWQVERVPRGSLARKAAAAARSRIFLGLERYASSFSDCIVTVAEQNRRQAIEAGLAPPDKIQTIYSGIDLDRFRVVASHSGVCQDFELDPHRPIVGFVGRLCLQKAPLDFLRAAHKVLAERPETQFIIVGGGPMAESVARATRGDPRIKIIGFTDRVPDLLSVLSVLGMSSLWEGLGRAVTEALIAGVPVAATAVDGVPEIVRHGVTGLLSAPGAPDELAANIGWLLENPRAARAMARAGRDDVAPRFSATAMVDHLDKLYGELLAQKLGGSKVVERPFARRVSPEVSFPNVVH